MIGADSEKCYIKMANGCIPWEYMTIIQRNMFFEAIMEWNKNGIPEFAQTRTDAAID